MSTYSVEMNINEIFMVEAEDAEDAVLQAESLAADGYDIELSSITIANVKEII